MLSPKLLVHLFALSFLYFSEFRKVWQKHD
jgi:hypothetical protein